MRTQNKNYFLVDKINEFGMKNIIALKPDDSLIPYMCSYVSPLTLRVSTPSNTRRERI